MGFYKRYILSVILLQTAVCSFSQPFTDIINASAQSFSTHYRDSLKSKNYTNNYFLNVLFPKELKNGNVLLIRINAEWLNSYYINSSVSRTSDLYAVSVPMGMQFLSPNKKWKFLTMAITKISSDFSKIDNNSFQPGGILLATYIKSENLKFKLGLYYSKELFGDFFMPLAGIDWKATERLQFYGVLPSNYRIEYKLISGLYTGLNFKSYTRSYFLYIKNWNNYVKNREIQLKIFLDYYFTKKMVAFVEFGRTIDYYILQFKQNNNKDAVTYNPIYTQFYDGFSIAVGAAYRIRK